MFELTQDQILKSSFRGLFRLPRCYPEISTCKQLCQQQNQLNQR